MQTRMNTRSTCLLIDEAPIILALSAAQLFRFSFSLRHYFFPHYLSSFPSTSSQAIATQK
jgi:hypothetical protein